MRTEDWLPVVVAGTAAAAVCYIAYKQAANAAEVITVTIKTLTHMLVLLAAAKQLITYASVMIGV